MHIVRRFRTSRCRVHAHLTTGRTSQQEGHLTVGDGLFGEIVEDDEGVLAVVAEELAHGSAGIRRQVLQGSGVGSGGGNHDAVTWSMRD